MLSNKSYSTLFAVTFLSWGASGERTIQTELPFNLVTAMLTISAPMSPLFPHLSYCETG
jgi:hypothetical protein